jgi:DnaK suppressor protein
MAGEPKARKQMSIDLERMKTLLEAKRAELRKSLKTLTGASPSSEKPDEANRDPVDREEAAIDVNEMQDEWFVRVNQEKILAEVEEALKRIEQGSYGHCVRCQQPIPDKRLLIIPWAARDVLCLQHHDTPGLLAATSEESSAW